MKKSIMKNILEKAYTEIGNDIAENMYELMTKDEAKQEKALLKNSIALEEKLKEGLTDEQKQLIFELSDANSARDCFMDDVMFRIGFTAGLEAGLTLRGENVKEKKPSIKEVI